MNELPRINKKVIKITSLDNTEEEKQFWLSKTPLERLEAVEINRRMIYGETRTTSRLQKVIEIAKLTEKE